MKTGSFLSSAPGRKRALKLVLLGAGMLLLLALPQLYPKSYQMGVMCRIFMYAILAGSLNVINGYSGQFNIGHAGFFCIGSYTEAILATKLGVSFWIALPIAGVAAAAIGLLVSLPTLKLKGIYLAIVTLGASEIIRLVVLNWDALTGGPVGIKNIPSPYLLDFKISKSVHYYYIFLLLAVLFFFATSRVIKSRVGRAWMSIREDELAARSLGVETKFYKATSFMYGAFWAGIAGAAFAPYFKFISSDMFTLDEGFNILSMVIIGGQGTLIGPIVGSVIVNFLTEFLRPISQYRLVVYALLIIVMMWVRPQGLVGASNSILAGGKVRMDGKGKGPGAKAPDAALPATAAIAAEIVAAPAGGE
jgi:branched-chain amino acid transport system permease protein